MPATSDPAPRTGLSRRSVLTGLLGGGVVVGGAGGYLLGRLTAPGTNVAPGLTATRWVAGRSFIAHRGSGDVMPENSLPAFEAALDWGALCMEVSVRRTSDGTLVVIHDDTYDRTTTGHGPVATQPFSYTQSVSMKAPQLGPGWASPGIPVPTFDDVLKLAGGKAVLAVEAKDDSCYDAMMAAVHQAGLDASVFVKAYWTNATRIAEAQKAGFPVFGYFGSPADVTAENVATLAGRLRPGIDVLVLWAYDAKGKVVDDSLIRKAAATGNAVWAAPVHRRRDADQLRQFGVTGIVTSNYGYVSRTVAPAIADAWDTKKLAPGELTITPDVDTGLTWTGSNLLTFGGMPGKQQFLCLGNLSPLSNAAGNYTIDLDIRWEDLPDDRTQHADVAFAAGDDRYYQHQIGDANGYHAILRADGTLQLYSHVSGTNAGQLLGTAISPKAQVGRPMHVTLVVTPQNITWSRTDLGKPVSVSADDSRFRGGYLHIGRASTAGSASFGNLRVT